VARRYATKVFELLEQALNQITPEDSRAENPENCLDKQSIT